MAPTYDSFCEDVLKKPPVFVIGSGLSLGAGVPGMSELTTWLNQHIHPLPSDLAVWERIQQQLDRVGLELALQSVGNLLSTELRNDIISQTWRCIGDGELDPLLKIAQGEDITGFVTLLRRFSESTQSTLHVVTTNYDHLLEWSAAQADWPVWDGFGRGPLAKPLAFPAWEAEVRSEARKRGRPRAEPTRNVRLYKVHGSIGWFRHAAGLVKFHRAHQTDLERLVAAGFFPAIVTPGIDKYLETHGAPYVAAFSEMYSAIEAARALVFVGFGFNDLHVQAPLKAKLSDNAVPKLILMKTRSTSLKKLIAEGEIRGYVAVERGGAGDSHMTSDVMADVTTGLEAGMWDLRGLLKTAWGVNVNT